MPRGTKKNANQHNNKHENGIVAPGKRITKQRSNGQLRDVSNANANTPPAPAKDTNTASSSDTSSTRANTPPLPSPPPGVATELHVNSPAQSNGKLGPPSKGRSSSASQNQPAPASSTPGDGKLEDTAAMDGGKSKQADAPVRKPDSSAMRPAAAPDASFGQHVSTIVSSRSLVDSLTVLVCLLSLPSWLHVVVNALFTLATFVPPSGSFSSLPTLSDFVSSFSPTTPSFAVMILIDSIAIFLWQFLPNAFQALVIDSAQAVVATTLGGGYSNKPGSPDNTLWCLGFATASHFTTRYKRSIYRILHRTWIGRWTPQFEMIEERSLPQDYPVGYDRGWFDTIQVFLALHIVCQGLTKMVRRSLYTSRLSTSTLPGSFRDSEVTAGTTGIELAEGVEHTRHGAQLRSKESLANLRDVNRDKISSGKRRRKQGNYTRSQQPLWAAFASTKASMAREYLSKDAKQDKSGSGSTDKKNLGDSPFETTKSKVWITKIHSNSLFFQTGPMDPSRSSGQTEGDEAGIDKTKPFFVRINGADWISVKMAPISDADDAGTAQWVGEIYGLSPTYRYQVSFIRSGDDGELYSDIVVTPALSASSSDPASSPVVAARTVLHSSPASPTATLKVSIQGCEARIDELAEKQRRARKENKQTHASLRREIDTLKDKISKTANSVETLQARQTRENQHIRQAEDAITSMVEELDAWKEIPEDEREEYRRRKAEYEATRNEHRDAKNELVRTKENNQRAIHALQAEASKEDQKNARLQQRVIRLKSQHERLINPEAPPAEAPTGPAALETPRNNSGSSMTRSQQFALQVQGWQDQVEGRQRVVDAATAGYNRKVRELHEIRQLELVYDQPSLRPRTPSEDGQLPGTGPQPPSTGSRPFFDLINQSENPFSTPSRVSTNIFDPFASSGLLQKTNSTGGHGKTKPHSSSFGNPRPRSTSIMSGNTAYHEADEGSGGTDTTAFEAFPSVPFGQPSSFHKRRSGGIGLVREGSNGGSSGSGSPRVLGGITRPPVREPQRESSWPV